MPEIQIPASKVPVLAECDVLVCGGGSAGVTAAVSAARHGAKVVLLERWPCVGGMATAAMVTCWHRSDRQKIVINGLVEESVSRLRERDWIRDDPEAPRVYETHWFEPEGVKVVWHRMLQEAGVRTICHTFIGDPILADARIRGVLVDTKRGRRAVLAKIIVDATGDGDVAAKAGLPFSMGRESDGRVQGMTLMYRLCGINDTVRRMITREQSEALHQEMIELSKAGRLPPFNFSFNPSRHRNRSIPNMCPVSGDPLDEEALTGRLAEAREHVYKYLDFMRERVPGFDKAEVEQTAFALGIRESRRIHGLKTLTKEMVLSAQKQPDAIGHGFWLIDIHDPLGTGYTTWNERTEEIMVPPGQSYHIPLSICLNGQIPNLAVVGRCASATHEGQSSMRVMSHCMVMGQGAGTVAAMALQAGIELAQVDIKSLQATLKKDGVYLEDVPE